MTLRPDLVAPDHGYFKRVSQIAAAEADQRLLGRGAVGHHASQSDDRAVALDQLVELAADRLPEGLRVDLAVHADAPLRSGSLCEKGAGSSSFAKQATVRRGNRGGDTLAPLTLFHGWRSSASRRVRLCLAEKGLAFDSN